MQQKHLTSQLLWIAVVKRVCPVQKVHVQLLRMGGDSLLVPVWRSVRHGFIGKEESDVWVVVQIAHI